jgi:hypothetical protein
MDLFNHLNRNFSAYKITIKAEELLAAILDGNHNKGNKN